MDDGLVLIIVALIGLAGGLVASRVQRGGIRGDLANKLVDQVQEERNDKVAQLNARDARIAQLEDRQRITSDYVVRLRRQIEDLGGDPEPYPGLTA